MFRFRREIVGIAAAVAVAVMAGSGCSSNIDEDDGASPGGSGGSSGSSGTAGTSQAECKPTAALCYGNRDPSTNPPGSECLATIDNSAADHVQLRQTWTHVVAPVGNTTDTVYTILKTRSQLKLPECYMNGDGGYIQLTDWDRTNKTDITQQTIRSGYASYSRQPPTSTAPTPESLVTDGMCMVEWDYTFTSPVAIPAVPDTALVRWQNTDPKLPVAQVQPWHVGPTTAKRVAAELDIPSLRGTIPAGEGVVYIDETTGYLHSYAPIGYVTVLDNRSGGLAVPIREVEIRSQFNDTTFNCMGRFRADKMTLAQNCDSPTDQNNPPWGCKDDSACPPIPKITEDGVKAATTTGPGASPSYTKGYFLIIDLERVWSSTLSATLCVTYPGEGKSATDGWSGAWGKNCRGSPKWDPTLPDDAGIPNGDWCSTTNSPATATCHDAYLSESFSTGQAFKVKPGTCPLE